MYHGYLLNKTVNWGHENGLLLNCLNIDAFNWYQSQIKQLIDNVGPIHNMVFMGWVDD